MNSNPSNTAYGVRPQIDVRFSVTGPETVLGLLGSPSRVAITHYGGYDPFTSVTYCGDLRTADQLGNNVTFCDYTPSGLPTYAADHLAEAKRIAAEWSQS